MINVDSTCIICVIYFYIGAQHGTNRSRQLLYGNDNAHTNTVVPIITLYCKYRYLSLASPPYNCKSSELIFLILVSIKSTANR